MSRSHAYLNVHRWARVRRQAFRRDGYRCTACGKAGRLECDHIDRDWRGDPYELANLQTLCRPCHIDKTGRGEPPAADAGGSRLAGAGGGASKLRAGN